MSRSVEERGGEMGKGRVYSDTFKTEAVGLVESGRTIEEVARQLGMPSGTLGTWVTRHRRDHPMVTPDASVVEAPVDPATYRAALRRITELERENEFLGKASASFAQKVHPERSSPGLSRSSDRPIR
jgi:transposase